MRVAVANWSSRRVGGVEDYVAMLLPALRQAGHAVAFWHEVDAPQDRPQIAVQDVQDMCAAKDGFEASLQTLRAWKPDVVYAHNLADTEAERRLLEVAPSTLFLHSYQGTCISGGKTFTRPEILPCDRAFGWRCLAHYYPHRCGGRSPVTMWREFRRQSQRLALLRRYGAILTHTEHMRTEMAKHGLDAAVVAFPVGLPAQVDTRRRDAPWRLLFAGRMEALKGGVLLLDALPDVVAALKQPVHMMFAGDGRERERWESRGRALQAAISNLTVEFRGWVAHEVVGSLMREADLLVVPSVWPEPFGSVGPAAAMHGVPAAAFRVGGIPEWLGDGITGHLAPGNPPTAAGLARAIVRCLEDRTHYSDLRSGAHEMSVRFTMARHLPQLVALFERTLAASDERPARGVTNRS